MGIKEKYATKAAAQLREKILAQIEVRHDSRECDVDYV